jgi:hypothetical protein
MDVAAHPNGAIHHRTSQREVGFGKRRRRLVEDFCRFASRRKGTAHWFQSQANVCRGLGAKRTTRTGRRLPTLKANVERSRGNILEGSSRRFTTQEKLRAVGGKEKIALFLKID